MTTWFHQPVSMADYAYFTDTPGVGGTLKQRAEDFLVDELPAYEPCGTGDHLYLFVEKRDLTTQDAAALLADHFQVERRSVGYAGLKDKTAITRQLFSLEHVDEKRVEQFEHPQLRILWADRHGNKLKRGHLAGNRFVIRIRDVDPTAVIRLQPMLRTLEATGVPNYFGPQRFGNRRTNHWLGHALLADERQAFLKEFLGNPLPDEPEAIQRARQAFEEKQFAGLSSRWPRGYRYEIQAAHALEKKNGTARDAIRAIDKQHKSFLCSAFQSAIFNHLLDQRIREKTFTQIQTGDLAAKHETGGMFEVHDPATDQPRFDAKEISPTGPLWGAKMRQASGSVGEAEVRALAHASLTPEQLTIGGYRPGGARRLYRMLVHDIDLTGGSDEHGPYIKLTFTLDRGCYATTLLREIMKSDAADTIADSSDEE